MHPVMYVSRKTTSEEQRYHSYELEALAVVWTVEKLRPYILGMKFLLVTDCNALQTALTKRDLVPRIG